MPPLSREFLLERGFCCNLGCVNCPYREKMEEYKPIKDGTTRIWLDSWACGDPECCNSYYACIKSDQGPLWESNWGYELWGEEFKKEMEEIREETLAACEHYGIEPKYMEENCVHDWEGERIL